MAGIDSYTKLLLHMDGDQSSSNHTVTHNDNPTYNTTTKKFGSSGLHLDGNADCLDVVGSSDFEVGTGDFAVDVWVNTTVNSVDTYYRRIFMWDGPTGNANNNPQLSIVPTSGLVNAWSNSGSLDINSTTDISDGDWHHVALIRSSGTVHLLIDGVSEANVSYTENINISTPSPRIGSYDGSIGMFNGYMDELRISNTDRGWSSGFTPPTSAYTSDANTLLLLHFDGDASDSQHGITLNGNSQLTYSTAKFGGSVYFDGTGDFLSLSDSSDWDFGSDDFTIDFWVNFSSLPGSYVDFFGQWLETGNERGWAFEWINNPDLIFYYSTTGADAPSARKVDFTPTLGTWYHIAAVRHGNNLNVYINGVAGSTQDVTGVTLHNSSAALLIGSTTSTSPTHLDGYMDEVRVSKGIARWTSDFDVPTEAYNTAAGVPNTGTRFGPSSAGIFEFGKKYDGTFKFGLE